MSGDAGFSLWCLGLMEKLGEVIQQKAGHVKTVRLEIQIRYQPCRRGIDTPEVMTKGKRTREVGEKRRQYCRVSERRHLLKWMTGTPQSQEGLDSV